jgi:uncharacterized protein (DUF2267 family)
MPLNFNKYATEGNAFMDDYIYQMNLVETPEKAARILPAILHALRDTIPVQESIQLLAQLPMFLKAVYVNGWSTKSRKQKIKTMEEFIAVVKGNNRIPADYDFISDELAEHYVHTTFFVLRKYISKGELQDIRAVLPKNLKPLI